MMIGEVGKVAARRYLRQQSCASLLQMVHVTETQSQIVPSKAIIFGPQTLVNSAKSFRCFSSKTSSDFLDSNKARILVRDLKVNTKDFSRIDSPSTNSTALDKLIKEAKESARRNFSLAALKELYYRLVRPELVSRLLIHNHLFNHTATHWLKYQTHAFTRQKPRFTTCYDVMLQLVGMNDDDWVFYLNYLSKERIAVIEEWVSISHTQHLFYDHGLKDFMNIHFHKGESDAAWHQKSNTGDFSSLIWDNEQIISARTHLGVSDCSSIAQCEVKAAIAILNEAKGLGIQNFVLWSDNKAVCGVLSGTKHIDPKDEDWELFMALRSLRPAFKRLVVMCVPREMVSFADGMLREPSIKSLKTAELKYPRFVKQSPKQWAYHLNGLPIFCLAMTPKANELMSSFGKPVHNEPLPNKFYVKVEVNKKISALQNLINVLNPAKLYVAVQDLEKKPKDVLNDLYDLVGNRIVMKSLTWSVLCNISTKDNPRGTVRVVFDRWCSELEKDLPVADMTVALCTSQDGNSLIRKGIPELSASAFIIYHGPCYPTEVSKDKNKDIRR